MRLPPKHIPKKKKEATNENVGSIDNRPMERQLQDQGRRPKLLDSNQASQNCGSQSLQSQEDSVCLARADSGIGRLGITAFAADPFDPRFRDEDHNWTPLGSLVQAYYELRQCLNRHCPDTLKWLDEHGE